MAIPSEHLAVGPLSGNDNITTDSPTVPASDIHQVQNLMNQNGSDNSLKSKAKDCIILVQEKESRVSGFSAHGTEDVKLLTILSGHAGELDCTPQLHPGPPLNIQAGDRHLKDMGQRSSASHEDSPVFSYVSSLSPIKPGNIRSIVQAYENIDVPSPQPVFTTPHFIRPRNSNLLERSQHLSLCDEEKISPGYANNTTESSENVDTTGKSVSMPMVQMISCPEKECDSDGASQGQPCITPSSCVDVFLADPSENGENPSGSPAFCLKRTGELPQNVHGDSGGTNENEMRCCKENLAEAHRHTSPVLIKESKDEHMEGSRFSDICDSYSNQATSSQVLNNNSDSLRETVMELRASDHKKFSNTKTIAGLSAPHQAEHSRANVSFSNEPVEVNVISTNEQMGPLCEIGTTYTGSSTVPALGIQQVQNPMSPNETANPLESKGKNCNILVQGKENLCSGFSAHGTEDVRHLNAKIAQFGELNCTPQVHLGSPHNIQVGDNHLKDLGKMSSISLGNQIPFDQEEGAQAAQHQRGKRKRLQFEAVDNHKMSVECEGNSWDFPSDSHVESPATSLELESVHVTQAESITPVNMLLIQTAPGNAFSVKVDRAGQCKGSSPVLAPRPSGIGLHLNSIGSTLSLSCNLNMKLSEGVQGENHPVRVKNPVLQDLNSCVSSASLTGYQSVELTATSEGLSPYSATANSEEKQHGYQALMPNTYVDYQSPLCVQPPEGSLQLKLFDRYLTLCDMKRLPSEDACRSEESTQTSPRKKRKKTPETEGSKHCNCKRSKCLKLYCDCFAAGALCSEACSCQECFNKSEYNETVQETRKQIESRNPLAFAPRVVLRVTDTTKDSSYTKHITPTSARHKRGCNCKKSLCLKKYCECFQAGVGCSMGCRCEGCKNTYGSKDGCSSRISEIVAEHKKSKEGEWDWDPSAGGTEMKKKPAAVKQNRSRLSPLSPLVHASSKNDISLFPASYYPSPDSGASILLPYEGSPSSALNSVCESSFAKEVEGNLALLPCNPDFEYHTTGKVDSLSPGWEGFPDICDLSPLPDPSPSACGSSCASKTRDPKVLKARLFQGSGRTSLCSLRWRSSPVTPLPQFSESKLPREPDSDSGLLFEHEDDTPEILKDTRLPIKAVKATSPNQKRVSPPHKALDESRSNSPAGLKSGRRFILRSVSAMASLTPYSKNSRGEDT